MKFGTGLVIGAAGFALGVLAVNGFNISSAWKNSKKEAGPAAPSIAIGEPSPSRWGGLDNHVITLGDCSKGPC